MTKIKKNTLLIMLLALMLATISALCCIMPTAMVKADESTGDNVFYDSELNEENTSETPTDEPSESENITTMPNVTEYKFDFGEWLKNAGEDVSAWLGDNVGIATTGSTVLIVAAVIIAVMLLKKRR